MSVRGPLVTGTIASLAVTAGWAWLSALTIGPSGSLDLTWRRPVASYILLAAAPTGNGLELAGVITLIFAVCFFVAGLRRMRRAGGTDGGL